MSPTDYTKKLLEEAGLKGDAERVVETLRRSPAVMGRVEPPAGYEAQLLAALSRKLPLEKRAPVPAPSEGLFKTGFLRSPAFSWSITAIFATLAVVSITNFRAPFDASSNDLLAQTARKGGSEVVGDWMASMGDTTLQKRVAMADINSAAKQLGSVRDQRVVEGVLTDVARKMGMK